MYAHMHARFLASDARYREVNLKALERPVGEALHKLPKGKHEMWPVIWGTHSARCRYLLNPQEPQKKKTAEVCIGLFTVVQVA